jgi:hypothetical protein
MLGPQSNELRMNIRGTPTRRAKDRRTRFAWPLHPVHRTARSATEHRVMKMQLAVLIGLAMCLFWATALAGILAGLISPGV